MQLTRKHINALFPLLLLLVTLVAYWPTTRADFIWDDDSYVVENTIYNTPDALADIWFKPQFSPQYYPVVFTTFYFERQLYGLNPVGYHVVNAVLHAASAALLWLILRRLSIPGPKLAAALFALHPVMTESVAWVTERKNTLSVFFMLLALLAFLHFGFRRSRKTDPKTAAWKLPTSPNDWGFYGLSLLLFALALLSKSVACGLAPLLVLLLWWKKPKGWAALLLLTLPFFILGLASGLFTAYLEVEHVGAFGPEFDLSFAQKILLSSRALCFYLYKFLLPFNLSFYYHRWEINPAIAWQWIFPALVLAILVGLTLSIRRIGKGPLVAFLAFTALLFPALGFFRIFPFTFSWTADHFAYHASPVFFAAAAAVLTLLARRFLPGQRDMRTLAAVPLLVILGSLTYLSTIRFLNYRTLWESIIAYDPANPHWNALNGLSGEFKKEAVRLRRIGREAEALALNEAAHEKDQQSLAIRPQNALVYNNLAGYHLFKHEPKLALPLSLKANELEPRDGRLRATLAQIYTELNEPDKAFAETIKAVEIAPRRPDYRIRAARALIERNKPALALEYLDSILKQLEPGNSEALLLKGVIFAQAGRIPEALVQLRASIASNPENLEALYTFADVVSQLPTAPPTDLNDAFQAISTAVQETQGNDPAYLDTLGLLLARQNRMQEAVGIWQNALLRITPKDQRLDQRIRQRLAFLKVAPVTPTQPATSTAPASAPASRPAATMP